MKSSSLYADLSHDWNLTRIQIELDLTEAEHMHYATLYHTSGKSCRVCVVISKWRKLLGL